MKIRSLGFTLFLLLFWSTLWGQFDGGSGTVEDPYWVATSDQLNQVRYNLSAHYHQTADINLARPPYNVDEGWTPIGTLSDPFIGSYDGDNHQIWGLFIRKPSGYNGLFGVAYNADIRNITLCAADVICGYPSAALVGRLEFSTLSNSKIEFSMVKGYDFTGGMVSFAYASEIIGCRANVGIEGCESVGGIVGLLTTSVIRDCAVELISSNNCRYQVGGVVGTADGGSSIIDCSFEGDLHGSSWVGGIVGQASDTLISGCTAGIGLLSGGDTCGGIVGDTERVNIVNCFSTMDVNTIYIAGGLVGSLRSFSTVQNCHASGHVNTGWPAGGFVGQMSNSAISNCFSTGTVDGIRTSGGFAGWIITSGSFVQNCYSTGLVTSIEYTPGGFAGSGDAANVVNCYWDMQSSACPSSPVGEGRNTIQMHYPGDASTYVNWDFEHNWGWEGEPPAGYPVLRIFPVSNSDPHAPAISDLMIRVYPNPFTSGTQISFDLAKAGKCSVKIYDLKGRLLRRLTDSHLSPGTHQFSFDACDDNGRKLCSGIYLVAIQQDGRQSVRRITVMK